MDAIWAAIIGALASVFIMAVGNISSRRERDIRELFHRINQLEKEHIRGDLLFGKNIGWGFVLDERITIYSTPRAMNVYLHKRGDKKQVHSYGYFINLRIAMNNDQNLSGLVSNLS